MTKNDHFGQILRISNVHYSAHRSKFKKQKNNVFYFLHKHKIPATRNFLCLTVSEIQIFHDVKFLKGWYRFGRAEREVIKFCDFRWVHSHWLRVDLMCDRRSLQTCKFLIFSKYAQPYRTETSTKDPNRIFLTRWTLYAGLEYSQT